MVNVILATARGDRLSLFVEHSEGWARDALDHRGQWPAWDPGQLAYAVSIVDRPTSTSRIEVRSSSGQLVGMPFRSNQGEPAVIGPRVPHYASWAPDGRTLSYVAATTQGLTQYIASIEALDAPRQAVIAAPLFSHWLPDSSGIVIHAADRLLVADSATGSVEELDAHAVGFRAPAVSFDGRLVAYCRTTESGGEVRLASPDGVSNDALLTYPSGVVLAFRPGRRELTVAATDDGASGIFHALELVSAASGERRLLWRSPFVSFAWSPNGDRVVLVVPTQMGDGRYALYCLDHRGRLLGATDGLLPSDETRAAFAFFDQYLQSHCAWSPDGRYFAIAARTGGDGVSGSLGDPVSPFVYTWEPGPRSPLRMVGAGTFVSFPPPA